MFSHIRQENPLYRVQPGPLAPSSPSASTWLTSRSQSSRKLPPAFTLVSFPGGQPKPSDVPDLSTTRRPSWPGQQRPHLVPSSDVTLLPSTRPHYLFHANEHTTPANSMPPMSTPTEAPVTSEPMSTWFSRIPAPTRPWPPPSTSFGEAEPNSTHPILQVKSRRSKGHHKKRHGLEVDDGSGENLSRSHRRSKHKKKSKRKNAVVEGPLMSTTSYPLYSISGSNWAFKGCQLAPPTPQVSTLETTFPATNAHQQLQELTYVRRSTSETERSEKHYIPSHPEFRASGDLQQARYIAPTDGSPSMLGAESNRRGALHTFSETMRRRPPAFQPYPMRLMPPNELRQPLPPPWRVKVSGLGAPPSTPLFHPHPATPTVMSPAPSWVPPHSRLITPLPSPAPPSIITRYNVAKVFSFTPFHHPPASSQVVDKLVYSVPVSSPSEMPATGPSLAKEADTPVRAVAPAAQASNVTSSVIPADAHSPTYSTNSFAVKPHESEESHPVPMSPVSSARLGRAIQLKEKVAPPKPTPTRSVSVSMSNECTVNHQKKSSTRRVKNRSLQLQGDALKASLTSNGSHQTETLVAFQSSPQRLPKLVSTGSLASYGEGSPSVKSPLASHAEHIDAGATHSAGNSLRGSAAKSVQRFNSIDDSEVSPSAGPWKSSSGGVTLQQRMSFATPSTVFGGADRTGPDEWSPLEDSSTENDISPCVAVPSVAPSASPTSVQDSPSEIASHAIATSPVTPGRSSLPSFPCMTEAPGFAEFVLGILASQRLVVEIRKEQDANDLILSLFEGSLEALLETREAEFAAAVESKWSVKSGELAQAAKLFSQATLSQVADVQKSNWFLDDSGAPMTIQSQLLTHVYHASQPRDLFSNYFNAGTQGLDKSLDLPKHLETRRIQNSIRRFLEFSLETFLIDTCLGSKYGCLTEWESSEGDVKSWVESARILSSELLRRPAQLAMYLRSLFAYLREKAGRALPEDDCGANAIPGEQLDAVLGDLKWWPPELNLEDRREILEAITLGNSKAQHTFARQLQIPLSFDPARPIHEEDFVAVLCSVPMNQPDFIMASPPRNFKDLASQNRLDEILREVIRVARRIAHSILYTRNDDPSELQLANDRLVFSLNQPADVSFQTRDSVRSRLFVAQDFLASYAVSIEELQIMALEHFPPSTSPHVATFSTDSLAASQSSDSSTSMNEEVPLLTPLEIAEDIIRASKSPEGFDFKEEMLPCLSIVQLAVEYMVGLSLHAMTNSERFTVRAPLSSLAVRVDPAAVVKRYLADPCPLPPTSDCMPMQCPASSVCSPLSKLPESEKSTPSMIESSSNGKSRCVTPSQCDFATPDELVQLTRLYEKSMNARIAPTATSSWGLADKSEASTNGGGDIGHHEDSLDAESSQQRVHIAPELLEAFVVIHSYESLREIQRLFITTDSASTSGGGNTAKDAITMKHEGLKSGDVEVWHDFWNQSGELANSLASHVQAGSWGPIRWNSLREIATVFCELQKKTGLAEI